jgi:hypothetical protein
MVGHARRAIEDNQDPDGRWLTVDEAAARRGTTVDAIRGLIRRGRIESRKDNEGRVRVRLPTVEAPVAPSRPPVDDEARLGGAEAIPPKAGAEGDRWRVAAEERAAQVERLRAELDELRRQVMTMAVEQARAQEQARAERAIADELRAQLAWHRQPWWRRWVG